MINYDTKGGPFTNVIESHMDYFDVLFPLNIGAFTYGCPENLSGNINTGMLVSAPLKNRTAKGIVTGRSLQIPTGAIKNIQEVYGKTPILSKKMIALLKWMADYYLAEQGLVLKNVLPKEAFTQVKQRKTNVKQEKGWPFSLIDIDSSMAAGIVKAINGMAYKTFLLYPPSSAYEYSFLLKILPEIRNGIILVPEVAMISNIYPLLKELIGERITLLHGELSRGKRSEAIGKILSGRSDIVLGTRSAVFAPLETVSFIAVLHEHSSSYKQEKSPCYNARDVAVMRGYLEKATVLLSSICPSIESFFNCKKNKYHLLKPSSPIKKPRFRLIDMKHEKRIKPYLSETVIAAAEKHIKNDKKIMFVVNRRGHSTQLQCTDCSHIEECPHCNIPLVFHKQDMSLKCHYCGHTMPHIPDRCGDCKGHNLKLSGTGTQKVQEDIEELTKIKTLRIDSDKAKKKSDLEGMIGSAFMHDQRIIVGTKLMAGRLGAIGRFSMAAVLNTDLFLNIPDFRSAEKAYQEISSVIDKLEPDGEVFVQTRMPQNYLFKYLKNYDYDTFFQEELGRRKPLCYPPYSRLILIRFESKKDLSKELSEIIKRTDKDVEILGPYKSNNKQGNDEFRLLIKSSLREKLHSSAKSIIDAFKDSKEVKLKVDVDPIVI
jgi:primosomal protein N' (replication factor Y) (superfamily II helicase)